MPQGSSIIGQPCSNRPTTAGVGCGLPGIAAYRRAHHPGGHDERGEERDGKYDAPAADDSDARESDKQPQLNANANEHLLQPAQKQDRVTQLSPSHPCHVKGSGVHLHNFAPAFAQNQWWF